MKNLRKNVLNTVKENNIETPNRPQNMKTVDLVEILENKGFEIQGENVILIDVTDKNKKMKSKGRPVNPKSKRQMRLKELEMKRENGEMKKGRPVNPKSKRQMRLKELEDKRAKGELKKGRPVDPNSKRQTILEKRENGEMSKGRPVDPNSKRQKRIKELEDKRAKGVLRRGRPKMNKNTDLILRERGY